MNKASCSTSNSDGHTELYFLIAKFLSSGPCSKASKVLEEELCEHGLLPGRFDYEGNKCNLSLEELSEKYPHIQSDTLLQVCQRLRDVQNEKLPNGLPGVSSFLAAGRFSLLHCDGDKQNLPLHRLYTRRRGQSLPNPAGFPTKFNIVRTLEARKTSGPLSRKNLLWPKMYSRLRLTHQSLGHISAVYCVLYDYTGRVIFTGADDLLVKVWSTISGRLLVTFRGARSEITDLAINKENTMLAAGSLDRILYVWCLQSTTLITQLIAHGGMITGVNFCPNACGEYRYLVSTSTDGSVAFWRYSHKPIGKDTIFHGFPVLFNEKIRPGVAQMICSAFSPGGTFLAAGSADHHVRVYYIPGMDGPQRIMEELAHTDRVDSMQWANHGLRFVSGSKDGTALIWRFSRQKWINLKLDTTAEMVGYVVPDDVQKHKPRVSMVCWDKTDKWIITAVHDASLKVWNSETGELIHVLRNHRRDVFVLEPHPLDDGILLSAGHDGLMCVWDIIQGKCYIQHQNLIENMGHKSFYDAKWSPDGTQIAATDSNGSVLHFSIGAANPLTKQLPQELFFNTDYWPLIRENGEIVDETTGELPHLLAAPFLVTMDGFPYPPERQRLVPGRETSDFTSSSRSEYSMYNTLRNAPQDGTVGGAANFPSAEFVSSRGNTPNAWQTRMLIPLLPESVISRIRDETDAIALEEENSYDYERQLPVITPQKHSTNEKKPRKRVRRPPVYQTRAVAETNFVHTDNLDLSPSSLSESDPSEVSSFDSDSSSTVYSDWIADHGVTLEPPTRSRRQRRPPAKLSPKSTPRRKRKTVPKPTKEDNEAEESEKSDSSEAPEALEEVPIEFLPPKWLSEVVPRKAPYYPQMGDYVIFFQEGYRLYLSVVREKQVYKPSTCDSFSKLHLQDPVFVQVVGIKYEIRPPRLCCLRLAVMGANGTMSNQFFNIKYHDVPDVIDFLVLKQTYDIAMSRQWKPNDRFRCMIEDSWWLGNIVSLRDTGSPFLSLMTKWDNGEEEPMSPWDLEPEDPSRLPHEPGGSIPVLPEETLTLLYSPRPDEWPSGDRDGTCDRIISSFDLALTLSIAEAFSTPVDLSLYPSYAMSVEYPIDLSTIKARLENRFYRRLTALQFDVRYVATNAEKFNDAHSQIVKHARIVTDLCLKIIKDQSVDVIALYRQLVDAYESNSEAEDDNNSNSSAIYNQVDWKGDCERLLRELTLRADSQPFRAPVDLQEFPDYLEVVKTPMDLGTVQDELLADNFNTPKEFEEALRLIVHNSRKYNTNKRSRIYSMSLRLSNLIEARMKQLSSKWEAGLKKTRGKNSLTIVRGKVRSVSPQPGPSRINERVEDPLHLPEDSHYETLPSEPSSSNNFGGVRLKIRLSTAPPKVTSTYLPSDSDDNTNLSELRNSINQILDSDNSSSRFGRFTEKITAENENSSSDSDNDDQVLSTLQDNMKNNSIAVNGHSYAKEPEENQELKLNGRRESDSEVSSEASQNGIVNVVASDAANETLGASSSSWNENVAASVNGSGEETEDSSASFRPNGRAGTRKSRRMQEKKSRRKKKLKTESSSSSYSDGSESESETSESEEQSTDSDVSYKTSLRNAPKANGKHRKTRRTRRSDDDDSDESSTKRRSKRKRRNSTNSESSNWQPSDNGRRNKRKSLRRRVKSPSSSDDLSDEPSAHVSSRGRVRKLTQRAREAYKKN